MPFRVLSRLMRGVFGVRQLDDAAARQHVIRQLGDLTEPGSAGPRSSSTPWG